MTKPGAYMVVDTFSKKFYIGSSADPDKRYEQHKAALLKGVHHCVNFQQLWDRSVVNLICIVSTRDTIEEAQALEQEMIRQNLDNPLMLNIGMSAVGGDNLTRNPERSAIVEKITAAVRERVKLARENPEEYKKLYPGSPGAKNGMFGKAHTPKALEKMRKAHEGRTYESGYKLDLTDEQRKERSTKASARTGERNSFFGRTHSEEFKQRIRIQNAGQLPPNLRKIEANGVVYASVTEAARSLGVSPALIVHRLKSDKPQYSSYKYL